MEETAKIVHLCTYCQSMLSRVTTQMDMFTTRRWRVDTRSDVIILDVLPVDSKVIHPQGIICPLCHDNTNETASFALLVGDIDDIFYAQKHKS